MTRKEAIENLQESKRQNKCMRDNPSTFFTALTMADGINSAKKRMKAIDLALSALRPVTREQVEKVWKGEWRESLDIGGFVYCSRCGYIALCANNYDFCPHCGSPFTDKAMGVVMERLEALNDEKTRWTEDNGNE